VVQVGTKVIIGTKSIMDDLMDDWNLLEF
jgi:hypothetical protein